MNRYIRSRLLGWPYADDGFGNELLVPDIEMAWYFVTGEVW